ncbi:hypothetical protein IKE67_09285 [bacterium]|nr:hypothetical protein [bacterium]
MENQITDNLSEKEYFNQNYNISYYDETLPKPSNNLLFMHYISSAVIYSFFTMFILFNPFYVNLYAKYLWAKELVIYLFLAYLLLAPIFLFILKPKTVYASHSIEIMNYILKLIKREGFKKDFNSTEFIEWLKPTYKQKQSLFLYFVKLYFGPQFILYSYNHYMDAYRYFNIVKAHFNILSSTNIFEYLCTFVQLNWKRLYYFMFYVLYFIDCFIFAIGYCTELCILKNRIRSVETTPLGLIFCLVCYVPIGNGFWNIVQWDHFDRYVNYSPITFVNVFICLISLLALTIYVSASVALFTKGSNLTNRGTVTCFPYNIVRHPAYSTKILGWIIGSIPVVIGICKNENTIINLLLFLCGAIFLTFIYYMRALTEERHLSKDPDYRAYAKKVKYQFIPGIW